MNLAHQRKVRQGKYIKKIRLIFNNEKSNGFLSNKR